MFNYKDLNQENYKIILNSCLFDEKWYIDTYFNNSVDENFDAIVHFLINGVFENYNPNPLFDTKILCCKFDLATSVNYDISQGYNSSLFVNGNSVHPNEAGCLKMYQRVKIDCPELFDSLI